MVPSFKVSASAGKPDKTSVNKSAMADLLSAGIPIQRAVSFRLAESSPSAEGEKIACRSSSFFFQPSGYSKVKPSPALLKSVIAAGVGVVTGSGEVVGVGPGVGVASGGPASSVGVGL